LIEKLGLETPGVGALLKEGSRAYVTLDLERERVGEYDKRWRVIVNHSIDLERII